MKKIPTVLITEEYFFTEDDYPPKKKIISIKWEDGSDIPFRQLDENGTFEIVDQLNEKEK